MNSVLFLGGEFHLQIRDRSQSAQHGYFGQRYLFLNIATGVPPCEIEAMVHSDATAGDFFGLISGLRREADFSELFRDLVARPINLTGAISRR